MSDKTALQIVFGCEITGYKARKVPLPILHNLVDGVIAGAQSFIAEHIEQYIAYIESGKMPADMASESSRLSPDRLKPSDN
jgi:hypothetical protein